MTRSCKHDGSVQWNPFNKAVQCHKCGETFFRLRLTKCGYVLVPESGQDEMYLRVPVRHYEPPPSEVHVFRVIDLADDDVVRSTAVAAYRAVRHGGGEPKEESEARCFWEIARAVHRHLYGLLTGTVSDGNMSVKESPARLPGGCRPPVEEERGTENDQIP